MKKVLIVEDNEKNRYLMRSIIEKLGHQAIEAHDGGTGVKKAIEERPDLILMDIQLPVLDGYETTRRIRSNRGARDVPIIAVTSYAMVGDREKCMAAGCTDYMGKPIDPVHVMKVVEKFLS